MPGPNAPYTQLDADQVLKQSFDENNDRLRVDASVTAVVAGVTLDAATSDIAIADRLTGDLLKVNPDGSIDANVVVSASGGDNIAISDGTHTLDINSDGSINVKATDLDIRNLTFATDKVDVSGSSVSVTATDLDIRNLTFATDKVDVSGSNVNVAASDLDIRNLSALQDNVAISNGTTSLAINLDGSVNVAGVATETTLSSVETSVQSIDAKLPALGPNVAANSISVTLATNQSSLDVNLDAFTNVDPDSVQLVGSINGTKTGTKYGIVNNLRLQILDSHDRVASFTYADFGTKNQRITQINYTSGTFPGTTVQRQFSYSLVGTNYRRDNETWAIV
jgi:hypothetical protein